MDRVGVGWVFVDPFRNRAKVLLPRGFGQICEATGVLYLSHVVRAWARPHVMLVRVLRCVSCHGAHEVYMRSIREE